MNGVILIKKKLVLIFQEWSLVEDRTLHNINSLTIPTSLQVQMTQLYTPSLADMLYSYALACSEDFELADSLAVYDLPPHADTVIVCSMVGSNTFHTLFTSGRITLASRDTAVFIFIYHIS